MNIDADDHPRETLRRLKAMEVLDVFVAGRIVDRVRIRRAHPLVGELMYDAAGCFFLSPEEDEKGRRHGRAPGTWSPA